MSCTSLVFRRPIPDDWERVNAVMPAWWGSPDAGAALPRVFFEHFRGTSLLVEHEDRLVAFLVGFLCPDHTDEAFVHVVCVAPEWRRAGLGRDLYRRFTILAQAGGRSVLRAVTPPANAAAVAFHTALGFSLLPVDEHAGAVTAAGLHAGRLLRFQLFLQPEADA
jgi:ribosomal protein S18 acetylase RimI-like enzyme